MRQLGESQVYNFIPISLTNPLALGHKINHPPVDKDANVKFIDIEIPYTFYPSEFVRYIPYVFMNQTIVFIDKLII